MPHEPTLARRKRLAAEALAAASPPPSKPPENTAWQTHRMVRGREFVLWLIERYGLIVGANCHSKNNAEMMLGKAANRRVYAALHEGENFSVWLVDRWMSNLGGHIWEIPDELWIERHQRGRTTPPDVKEAALKAYREGTSAQELREQYGVSRSTVIKWAQAERKAA